jgi:flavin reductase
MMSAQPASSSSLRDNFLQGMSNAACTVNIVTTDGVAGRYGLTISAMVSVSADTPQPTLLVCVNERSAAARPILDNGCFCVNVLRDDQHLTSDCFAGRSLPQGSDKFSKVDTTVDSLGCPVISGALVSFTCKVASSQIVGTHLVLLGNVCEVANAGPGSPLIHANRAYGRPVPLPASA